MGQAQKGAVTEGPAKAGPLSCRRLEGTRFQLSSREPDIHLVPASATREDPRATRAAATLQTKMPDLGIGPNKLTLRFGLGLDQRVPSAGIIGRLASVKHGARDGGEWSREGPGPRVRCLQPRLDF